MGVGHERLMGCSSFFQLPELPLHSTISEVKPYLVIKKDVPDGIVLCIRMVRKSKKEAEESLRIDIQAYLFATKAI